jgi:hypothetical protein
MRPQSARFLRTLLFFAFFSLFVLRPPRTFAQTAPAPSRITQAVDEANLTLLKGNTYYLARAKYDRGAAPSSLPMARMLLVLQRSPQQESALEQLLDQQQDQSSPNYHQWLAPQQFGQQFGPSDQDIQKVASWLQSHGFQVEPISNGRTVIEFSGTAGQVQEAFHTSIHKYSVPTKAGALEDHWANSTDPSIPAALAPVVAGINTLHNFPRKPMHVVSGVFKKNRNTGETKPVNPEFSFTCGTNQNTNQPIICNGLGPFDFATIYNVLPLWNGSPAPVIDGTGQTIAIIGETDVDMKDIENFRSLFGLPANDPVVVLDGPDPGVVPGDETESDLDLEWSGAVAKGATIKFVTSATTNTTLGVDLSAQYAVDHNVAPVMSESYGICELGLGTAGNQFYNSVWQQAAAQGITAMVSAGDAGSAGCDSHGNPPPAPAEFGLQVSGFASTPYNVAVGGTDFNDLSNPTTYFSSTNNPTTQLSAKSYIPEVPWNDSCTSQALVFFGFPNNALENCNDQQLLNVNVFTVGGSGGKSACTTNDGQDVTSCSGGYAKPSWQTGTGVPSDGKRDIPDVSLFASAGFYTGSFYIVCEADQTSGVYCDQDPQAFDFLAVGGTSASSPAFAGIMALVNQKTASRQGNANYILYKLAAQSGASCTSSGTPASTCVFYDITTGTNAMPCDDTVPVPVNCGTPGPDGIGILTGYNSTAGYDLTTGLGSVNAANLVNKWTTITSALKPSTTTLSLNPTSAIVHGTPVTVQINVTPTAPATGTATGNVALLSTTAAAPPIVAGVTDFALTSGAVNSTTDVLPGGTYTVTAHYPGDGTFAASDSTPVPVTITSEGSKVAVTFLTRNSQGFPLPFTSGPYGSPVYLRADVSGNSGNGVPSGTVTFKDNGAAITGIAALTLNSQGNVLPTTPTFTFTAGTHPITGAYSGDPSFNASTSSAASFTITQAPTSIIWTDVPVTSLLGAGVSMSVVLQGTSCGNPPTGTMTFFDGATPLGTPQTVQGSVQSQTCTIGASASINTTALPLGQSTVTVKYSGDVNYASSVSPPQTADARIPTTTALATSNGTIQQGSSVTFSAIVTPNQAGGPTPTGTIQFSSPSGGPIGGAVTLTNGQAQVVTKSLPSGSLTIIASYSGDINSAQSQGTVNETVTPGPDFSISFAPATLSVSSPGANATAVVTVAGSNGYNGAINFSAASCSGLPSESSCSFSPASVTGSGTTTLMVSTTAPSSLIPLSRHIDVGGWRTTAGAIRILLLCAALLALAIHARRRRWNFASAILMFTLLIGIAACGGGGGGGGVTPPPTNPGTPVVTNQIITVTATSGSITHTFTFTLNVN